MRYMMVITISYLTIDIIRTTTSTTSFIIRVFITIIIIITNPKKGNYIQRHYYKVRYSVIHTNLYTCMSNFFEVQYSLEHYYKVHCNILYYGTLLESTL